MTPRRPSGSLSTGQGAYGSPMGVLGWVITAVIYLAGLLFLGLAVNDSYEKRSRPGGGASPSVHIGLFVVVAALYSLLFASWLR